MAHTAKLQVQFDITATDSIWAQQKRLIHKYKTTSDFRRRIKELAGLILEESWKRVAVGGKFDLLSKFAVGLASIAPGTHTGKGEFSTI